MSHYWAWNKDTDELTPIDLIAVGQQFNEDFESSRRIGRDYVRTPFGTLDVSTVFLAIDHSFYDGPPVLFETMIFNGPWDERQERYHTAAEARAGHAAAVRTAKQARYRLDWWLAYWYAGMRRAWQTLRRK